MWNHKFLYRIDFKVIVITLLLMLISILVISSMTMSPVSIEAGENVTENFMTPYVRSQLEWFVIGWLIFLFFAGFDYNKLREWSWFLYFFVILLLLGLYFADPIQSVHRWYRLPLIKVNIQPSEHAKLIIVICLAWFLEKKQDKADSLFTALQIATIVGIPFLLILKQPDLGTALVLYPITLVMCYFANIHKMIFKILLFLGIIGFIFSIFMLNGVLPHKKLEPFFTSFMKKYQYERFNPNTYHKKASQIAIAIGGISGNGWHKSEFAARKWLPAAHTDSVFAAFGEEFGLIGLLILLLLFYFLIYISFQVALMAKDYFGKFLASGIAVYFGMHIIVNVAMMCGFLPISGVPLLLITYGGSSVITTMAALGILQSIYTRRFMF